MKHSRTRLFGVLALFFAWAWWFVWWAALGQGMTDLGYEDEWYNSVRTPFGMAFWIIAIGYIACLSGRRIGLFVAWASVVGLVVDAFVTEAALTAIPGVEVDITPFVALGLPGALLTYGAWRMGRQAGPSIPRESTPAAGRPDVPGPPPMP
jgi:hypothetical protein